MKNTILKLLFIALLLSPINFFSQSSEYRSLMKEGIELHDNGKYKKAIKKYDKAFKLDKSNITPLYEKASSLYSMGKYKEAIKVCEISEEIDPNSVTMRYVYTCKANCYDLLKKPDKAIATYKKGIEKFPNYYQLYFNKGITEISNEYYIDCEISFKKSISINPDHAGSHNALARVAIYNKQKLPQIFLLSRYLIIDPSSERANGNLQLLENALFGNVEKTGENSTSISLDLSSFGDSTEEKKPNDFSSTELIMGLSAALKESEVSDGLNDAEILKNMMEIICSSLSTGAEEGTGYYWERFAPYFIEMKNEELLETFSYIAYASSDNKKINKWLKKNEGKIKKFYEWNKNYEWE